MKHFFTIALSVLLLSGCQKNFLSEQENSLLTEHENSQVVPFVPGTIGRLQLLTREVSFNSLNPSLKQVREYLFDEQNRCTKVLIGTIDSSGNVVPVFNVSRTLTFVYEGMATLPVKVQSVRTVFPNTITEFFYTYDSKGNKIKDSVRVLFQGLPSDRVVHYQYIKKDSVYAVPEFVNFPLTNNSFDTLYYSNHNIQKFRKYTITATGFNVNEYLFEYDNNINPYSALNVFNSLNLTNPALGIGFNIQVQTNYSGLNRNNVTAFTVAGAPFRFVINYLYDNYKYPVWSEAYPEGSPNKFITYYTYKQP